MLNTKVVKNFIVMKLVKFQLNWLRIERVMYVLVSLGHSENSKDRGANFEFFALARVRI